MQFIMECTTRWANGIQNEHFCFINFLCLWGQRESETDISTAVAGGGGKLKMKMKWEDSPWLTYNALGQGLLEECSKPSICSI